MKDTEIEFIKRVKNEMFSIDSSGKIWRNERYYRGKKGGLNRVSVDRKRAEILTDSGYLVVNIRHLEKQRKVMAHRAVWIYFNGSIAENLDINHINGVKSDNRPENLELLNRSQNVLHAISIGLLKVLRGENHGMAKVTKKDVILMRRKFDKGEVTAIELSKKYKLNTATIHKILSRKLWKSV